MNYTPLAISIRKKPDTALVQKLSVIMTCLTVSVFGVIAILLVRRI